MEEALEERERRGEEEEEKRWRHGRWTPDEYTRKEEEWRAASVGRMLPPLSRVGGVVTPLFLACAGAQ